MTSRRSHLALRLVGLVLLWSTLSSAQDLALTTQSEAGFRRFMQMAKAGKLGADVADANVGVFQSYARVELLGVGVSKTLRLTRRSAGQGFSRYFDVVVEDGGGATPADVERVGRALDEAFTEDPFVVAVDFFGAAPGDPTLSYGEAWDNGGWQGVLRAGERHLSALASFPYTVAVIVVAAVACLAGVLLLWGWCPPLKPWPEDERS